MKHILVTRIDDRLIRGQVVTAQIKQYLINKILIIDDELSRNKLMGRIYKAATPVDIEVAIMDQEMTEGFLKEDPGPKGNLTILVKVPQVLEKLIGDEISIDKVISGGMGARPGRKTFNKNVSTGRGEMGYFKRTIGGDVEICCQLVPDDKEVNIRKILSRWEQGEGEAKGEESE